MIKLHELIALKEEKTISGDFQLIEQNHLKELKNNTANKVI